MPYIDPTHRAELDAVVEVKPTLRKICSPGELNYKITKLVVDYLNQYDESYGRYNEVIGVLTCVQHELYRRAIAPYEDVKKDQNGDVFVG
jgi:hypothetical protein